MLPEIFLERMRRLLGEEYDAFVESLGGERHRALRLNSLKRGVGGHGPEEAVRHSFAPLERVPWAEDGYYYFGERQPGKHPYHGAGLYYIQEPSAMAPVELLGVRPGERVLDLCAAPGGKSTQIAARLGGSGLLFCNEIHPARARILSENIERLGVCNACVTNESPERLAERFPGYFDRILVDAPCSGEGMFRKNGTACEEWSPENIKMCAARQDGILDQAAQMLRPGGRLVYSTCTFAPEEDEGSVVRFLRRHGEFHILSTALEKERWGLAGCHGLSCAPQGFGFDAGEGADVVLGMENALRLWPHRVRGEGHFAAVLEKEGRAGDGYRGNGANGVIKGVPGRELKELEVFCRMELRLPLGQRDGGQMCMGLGAAAGFQGEARYIRFGDNLYLVPAQTPPLAGLKVLRPGLHVGELKKGRFEPSHALALALRPDHAAHVWRLDLGERTVGDYLNGVTFPAQGAKGWYLVCVDGFGTGWGKLAGGIMKNHYPKGLRVC